MNTRTLETYDKLSQFVKDTMNIDLKVVHGVRKGAYVRARASIAVSLTRYLGTSTVDIGELLGYDHTTVIHHRDNHSGRYMSDEDYAETYDAISSYTSSLVDDGSNTELVKVLGLIRDTLTV